VSGDPRYRLDASNKDVYPVLCAVAELQAGSTVEMFYEPGVEEHNLPYDPFKVCASKYNLGPAKTIVNQACVVPRPIGWISTQSPDGISNLAPYSQFNNLNFDPPYVMFSANQTAHESRKDTVINIEATGTFVWNIATWATRKAVNISAEQVPYGVDEFVRAGLTKEKASLVDPFMVKESPIKFECKYHSTIRLPGNPPMGTVDVIIGKVIGIHIADEVLTDGKIDVRKTEPIARCGYYEYAVIRDTFQMVIPGPSELVLYGLEGSSAKNKAQNKVS
jgi:flavin reductase (DIM6/NTAB) family NADH-FMN oxidoreductase RutF